MIIVAMQAPPESSFSRLSDHYRVGPISDLEVAAWL
jgi:hypothetical protein